MTEAEYDLRERECIMEFDGGLTREEAERKAAEMALILAEALSHGRDE